MSLSNHISLVSGLKLLVGKVKFSLFQITLEFELLDLDYNDGSAQLTGFDLIMAFD